jgi:hypothetical protein
MSSVGNDGAVAQEPASGRLLLIFSWFWVGLPLAWGVWETVRSSLALVQ